MGFINAAALIIAMSQLSDLLGIESARTGRLVVDVWAIIGHIGNFHPLSLAFGVTAFVLFVAFRRYAPRLPGMLITVAIMIGASRLVGFADRGGNVVGAVAAGLPGVGVPAMGWGPIAALLPAAFVIALISFMEAASSCKLIAIKKRVRWDENQELIGQGLAKISAAFCQSIPVSGSFSRSALNLASNARTGWSALVGAACVLVTLLFLTSWLWHLPKPVLAAAIMLPVVGLFDLSAFRRAWRASRDDGIAATATFIATLAFAPNIQNGLLTGIIISLAAYFYGRMRPSVEVFVVPASRAEPPAPIANAGADGTVGVLRFDAAIYFANVSYFEEAVLMLEHRNPDLRHIVVVASGINSLDASAVEMLRNLAERLRESGITLALTGVKRPVREVIERTGLIGTIGTANIFATETIAVEALRARDGSASP